MIFYNIYFIFDLQYYFLITIIIILIFIIYLLLFQNNINSKHFLFKSFYIYRNILYVDMLAVY